MSAIDTQQTINVGSGPTKIDLGGDMSANRTSGNINIGNAEKFGVTILWPSSVGAARPTGKFWIKTNKTNDTDGYALIEQCQTALAAEWPTVTAAQPAGDGAAGKFDIDNIETAGPTVQIGYDATGGGTGVAPTCFICAK